MAEKKHQQNQHDKDEKWSQMAEQAAAEEVDETQEQADVLKEPAGALGHAEQKELLQQLTEAEQKAEQHYNRYMRAQADIENIKKRSARELENAHKFAIEKFVLELLPVVDSLETSIEKLAENHNETTEAIVEGIKMTLKIFLDAFAKFEVKQIDPLGQPFDPALHEAMSVAENSEVDPNTVTQVLQKGYQLYGRLVRPAMVIVAKG